MSLPATAPSAARSRALAFAGLLLGGALGLVAGSQAWWRASGGGTSVSFTGNQASGGLTWALAAVLLAGALLGLVLRARGRRVIAVVLALTGLGMVVTGALQSAPDADTVRSRVRQVSLTDQFALSPTAWPWLYAAGGLIVVAGAVLLWWGAPRWGSGVSRFERKTPRSGPTTDLGTDPGQVWKDQDAGLDPTDDLEAGVGDTTARVGDPDVRPGEERVTMDHTHDQRRE